MDSILSFFIKLETTSKKAFVTLISTEYLGDDKIKELINKYLPINEYNYHLKYNTINNEFEYKIDFITELTIKEIIQYWDLNVIDYEVRAYQAFDEYEVTKIKRTDTKHEGEPTPIVLRIYNKEEKILGLYDWSHIMIER